ncbi:hypothetical protein Ahy_B10g100855 [Arachis hypogaea]|uniref:SCP domain-containing protein n=1 Tax=Arachis hypogaea TaxID=3818 RepID=A0A444WXT0_ARAHY|nr:hypothetical protein Ahy_B10g100855 [Arachis hypogaea]
MTFSSAATGAPRRYSPQVGSQARGEAQNSPKDYLKAHNDARAEIGVKPLKWDSQLASHAHKFVKKHIFDCEKGIHDMTIIAGNKYGQNIAYNSGSVSGADAVNEWLKQKTNYDYKSNSCIDEKVVERAMVVFNGYGSRRLKKISILNLEFTCKTGFLIFHSRYGSNHDIQDRVVSDTFSMRKGFYGKTT